MALGHFQRTFTDAAGNIKPGLSVTVRRESDNGLAALFADAGSVTPKSNPFNTDANGYGSFYVTDGRYRIQATDIDWRDTDIFISPTFYAQLAGGPLANFTAMPQVGGDPIVESGSNADGEWTRWADGTQTCYQYEGSVRTLTGTRDGLYFLQTSKTFPAAFTGTPSVSPTGEDISQGLYWATYYSPSSTTFGYEAIGTVASAAIVLGYTAIGRWK